MNYTDCPMWWGWANRACGKAVDAILNFLHYEIIAMGRYRVLGAQSVKVLEILKASPLHYLSVRDASKSSGID